MPVFEEREVSRVRDLPIVHVLIGAIAFAGVLLPLGVISVLARGGSLLRVALAFAIAVVVCFVIFYAHYAVRIRRGETLYFGRPKLFGTRSHPPDSS